MSTRDYYFAEDRTTYLREQILRDLDGTESALDISSSSLDVYFRMYQTTGGGLLINAEATKVAIGGPTYADTGDAKSGVEYDCTPSADYGAVICRFVLVDKGTVNANTPSGYKEVVKLEWPARVNASPSS